MARNVRGLVLFQLILISWMSTSTLMVSALVWALFCRRDRRPGFNLKEL